MNDIGLRQKSSHQSSGPVAVQIVCEGVAVFIAKRLTQRPWWIPKLLVQNIFPKNHPHSDLWSLFEKRKPFASPISAFRPCPCRASAAAALAEASKTLRSGELVAKAVTESMGGAGKALLLWTAWTMLWDHSSHSCGQMRRHGVIRVCF